MGAAALATLLGQENQAAEAGNEIGLADLPHHKPKAKRVIYLFQSGGPSHIDLWDYKPNLTTMHGKPLPDSVKGTQRVTGMTAGQKQFLTNAPIKPFQQHGECGRWVSDLLPQTAKVVDELAVLKAVHTRPSIMIQESPSSILAISRSVIHRSVPGSVMGWVQRIRIFPATWF